MAPNGQVLIDTIWACLDLQLTEPFGILVEYPGDKGDSSNMSGTRRDLNNSYAIV